MECRLKTLILAGLLLAGTASASEPPPVRCGKPGEILASAVTGLARWIGRKEPPPATSAAPAAPRVALSPDPASWAADGFERLTDHWKKTLAFAELKTGETVRFVDVTTGKARELRFLHWSERGDGVFSEAPAARKITVPDMQHGFRKLYGEENDLYLRKDAPTATEVASAKAFHDAVDAKREAEQAARTAYERPPSTPEELAREGVRLAPELGDLTQLSRERIEAELMKLHSLDPRLKNQDHEALHYLLMQQYEKFVPRYDTVEELIAAGLLVVKDGYLTSDYMTTYTHLGVLTLGPGNAPGMVQVVGNRGTSYIRGTDYPGYYSGFIRDAAGYIQGRTGRQVFEATDLAVVVAVPASEGRRKLGRDISGEEYMLDFRGMPARVFKTKVSGMDVWEYAHDHGLKTRAD